MCRLGVSLMLTLLIGVAGSPARATGQPAADPDERITSRVETTAAGELILVETVEIRASLAAVWEAFTTPAGYASWAAPVVEIDLRVGGTIRTHYDPSAQIGDADTIVLRVVSYVPERLLTLQADISQNWPAIISEQAAQLYNVILFEPVTDDHTRVVSYGLGYRDSDDMRDMMNFFITANAQLYAKLVATLEAN